MGLARRQVGGLQEGVGGGVTAGQCTAEWLPKLSAAAANEPAGGGEPGGRGVSTEGVLGHMHAY